MKQNTFSPHDLVQINESGRNLENILAQLDRFVHGFPPLKLSRPVTPGDGLFQLDDLEEQEAFIEIFEEASRQHQVCKFVPASGAASRMFKTLYAFINTPQEVGESQKKEVAHICENFAQFAFFSNLNAALSKAGFDLDSLLAKKDYPLIINHLLSEKGLNYGNMPKALLPFHQYDGFVRTALEEHLAEAAHYCISAGGQVRVHFTVSAHHQDDIQAHLNKVVPKYEELFPYRFHIETSIQHPKTDTLAVDLENQPVRDDAGKLVFRPGGHGALLENLNQLEADWVFIKNIDNVVPDNRKASTFHWKKVIGGVLISFQRKIFHWLLHLGKNGLLAEKDLVSSMEEELGIGFVPEYESWENEKRLTYLRKKLNRPIRVCGVIRTTENTGGGPFWVENKDKTLSLQIVETAQIDLDNPGQKAIAAQSRIANITDLVCGLKDYQGKKFDLLSFRDEHTGFITEKSLNGKSLKALELPGLWNGSMADWHTILVEVPVSTFNPVKSVSDLLNACRVT